MSSTATPALMDEGCFISLSMTAYVRYGIPPVLPSCSRHLHYWSRQYAAF